MIGIKTFREYISEMVHYTNQELELKIDHVVLAVNESHMTKKLQAKSGVCLCVSFPDAQATGQQDNPSDQQKTFLFICQRISPGQMSEEEEILRYNDLQGIMLSLRDVIREESYKIEWEYQIFGGMNGLSMGLKFKSYD